MRQIQGKLVLLLESQRGIRITEGSTYRGSTVFVSFTIDFDHFFLQSSDG